MKAQFGRIEQIQLSTERIVKLNGILLDLDPGLLRQGPLIPALALDPKTFYRETVKPWLSRHPVLRNAEVRISGTGITSSSGLITLSNAAKMPTERWSSLVQIVQAALPTDPHAPGITATTRAIGSTNTKRNTVVQRLKKGRKVSQELVVRLQEEMSAGHLRPCSTFSPAALSCRLAHFVAVRDRRWMHLIMSESATCAEM